MAGIAGIYNTGYTFFDIDLDGEKELAVQLGGGSLNNCSTLFYDYEEGVIKQKDILEETYSLSVNELVLLNDGLEDFFVNKYRLKIEPTQYIIFYDKIYKEDGIMKTENLFSVEENYDENDTVSYKYYVKENEVEVDKYNAEFELFFDTYEEKILSNNFIQSDNFLKMSRDERKTALKASYSAM